MNTSLIRCLWIEGLSGYNFFESRVNGENERVIVKDSEQWIVYATLREVQEVLVYQG